MEPSFKCSIPVSVDRDLLSSANKQPGQLEPSPKSQARSSVSVEPLLSTNGQAGKMELLPNIQTSMPFGMEFQQLSVNQPSAQLGTSPKFQASMCAIGSQQLSFKNKQSIQMEQSPKAHRSSSFKLALQQPLSVNKQSVQKDPASKVQTILPANKGSKQVLSSKLAKVETLPKSQSITSPTLGTPQLSSKNKRKSQVEKLPKVQSINLGSQATPSTNRKIGHAEQSPKVQTESFESVRSKLRESLAAALDLVSDEQRKSPATGRYSCTVETNTEGDMATRCQQGEGGSRMGNVVPETPLESKGSKANEDGVLQKTDGNHCLSSDTFTNESAGDYTRIWNCDMQDFELKNTSLEGDMLFSNNLVFKDELLQGNGLCWASDFDVEGSESKETSDSKRRKLTPVEPYGHVKESVNKTQFLATKIEAELFRLFGGVNKKYKEKGRSLLFNLKDPNNPELRERVFSEEITPERLCSMTAEELASKQLTEWRIAKAEELAQMVVLPESDVDLRRLVKKTHKGEFQVEVERDDTVPVEAAVSAQIAARANETKNHLKSMDYETQNSTSQNETEASNSSAVSKKVNLGALEHANDLSTRPQDMQEFMVDELKDAGGVLPPIVSLDEFMEALDSEPPFENLPMDAERDLPYNKKGSDGSETKIDYITDSSCMINAVPESLESKSNATSHSLVSKSDKTSDSVVTKHDYLHAAAGDPVDAAVVGHADEIDSINMSASHNHASGSGAPCELINSPQGTTSKGESIWEGLVQLNISSLVALLGFFKSGEKGSTEEWPSLLEIKGRVRVDAFEKFLQELRSSRSRAIMIVHFQWKEGSPESGRASLTETVDSYVADERVGFAEPAPGVELYFCPPHTRLIQMLEKHIPKEHTEALASTNDGLIGVVVWRRPYVTSTVSPRLSANHKHSSSRRHLLSRKQQHGSNADVTNKPSMSAPVNTRVLIPEPQPEEAIDDVPPGFGPRATRDEDDLPEFDFRGTRPTASLPLQVSGGGTTHSHGRPLERPVQQMRELIHKYGQGETGSGIPSAGHMQQPHIQPWDDDEDDIPEWHPHRVARPSVQGIQQQTLQPHQTNQHHLLPPPPPKAPIFHHAPAQLVPPLPMPLQPQMGMMQVAQGVQTAWQPGAWWPHDPRMPAEAQFSPHGLQRPCHYGGPPAEGQHNGLGRFGDVQNAMDWRPSDVRRSSGM